MNNYLIDVREPDEYKLDHVDGSANVPLSDLLRKTADLSQFPKDANLVLYCTSGRRSEVAMNLLSSQGYNKLTNGIDQDTAQKSYSS